MDDTQTLSWLKIILAVSVVTALLAGLGFALKWLQRRGWTGVLSPQQQGTKRPRLSVKESRMIDMHHRLVLIEWDQHEHLLLLGKEDNLVIASKERHDSSVDNPSQTARQ